MLRQPTARVELQDRDLLFLRGLFECRVMKNEHAASLYFEGRRECTKKRLRKLKLAGLLAERPRTQFEPAILSLTRQAITMLRARGELDCYPVLDIATLTRRAHVSDMTLKHELAVLDIKAALHRAIVPLSHLSLLEFTTWPRLSQFRALGDLVKPDAFLRIRETLLDGTSRDNRFYVEIDRSTESLNTLCSRARSYAAHYKSEPLSNSHSSSSSDYKKRSFRVLYILRSHERLKHVAGRLRTMTPPILSLVWLATFADVNRDPLGAIWTRPMDYRNAHPSVITLLDGHPPSETNASNASSFTVGTQKSGP